MGYVTRVFGGAGRNIHEHALTMRRTSTAAEGGRRYSPPPMGNWTSRTSFVGDPVRVLELLTDPDEARTWSPIEFTLEDREGRLVLAGAPPSVLRVLDLTGLASKFELAPEFPPSADDPGDAAIAGSRIGLTADAELVLGLLATALPFAESRAAEAERWLRVLRSHGDTARILREIGVSEAPSRDAGSPAPSQGAEGPGQGNQDPTQHVIEQATALARERGANLIGTLELLAAVMQAYGEDFDEVLHSHGTNRAILIRHINREASPSV